MGAGTCSCKGAAAPCNGKANGKGAGELENIVIYREEVPSLAPLLGTSPSRSTRRYAGFLIPRTITQTRTLMTRAPQRSAPQMLAPCDPCAKEE